MMNDKENEKFEKSLKNLYPRIYPELGLKRTLEIYKQGFINGLNIYKPKNAKCNCIHCGVEYNNELDLSHHVQICEKLEEEN